MTLRETQKLALNEFQFKIVLLDYEVRSSWWAEWCGASCCDFIAFLAGRWFAWKVNVKYRRYRNSLLALQQRLDFQTQSNHQQPTKP